MHVEFFDFLVSPLYVKQGQSWRSSSPFPYEQMGISNQPKKSDLASLKLQPIKDISERFWSFCLNKYNDLM